MRLVASLVLLAALSTVVSASTGIAPSDETVTVDPCQGIPDCELPVVVATVSTPGVTVPEAPSCSDVCLPTLPGMQGEAGIDVAAEDRAQAQTQATEAPTPTGADIATIAITGGLALGGVALLLPIARGAMVLFFAPLAARLDKSRLLEDPTRQAIMDTVRNDPGINLRALADEVDVAWGTILHHVHKLENAGFLVAERVGRYRRYYVNGSGYNKEDRQLNGLLLAPGTGQVAQAIQDMPGASQRDLSRALDLSPSTVLWHVRRLREAGLVDMERDGRRVRYHPTDTLESVAQAAA